MAQKLKDIMTPNPATCPRDATMADVARLMRDRDIGAVIVQDGDRVAGIATDRDITVRGLAEGRGPQDSIGDIITTDVVALSPEDDITTAVETMRSRAVRRLPVVEDGRPVGIISIGDLAMDRDPDSALADISAAGPNN
jgi:CBS domain-containing protein